MHVSFKMMMKFSNSCNNFSNHHHYYYSATGSHHCSCTQTIINPLPNSLQELDLSRNRLKQVPVLFYKNHVNLTTLSLRKNHLTWIEPYTFSTMQALRRLDLSEQQHFIGVSDQAMTGLKMIEVIVTRVHACASLRLVFVWLCALISGHLTA